MAVIPWPLSNHPGEQSPEGTGRLVNVFVEPRGDGTPVWKRVPGATVFARVPSSGSASLEIEALARGGQFFSTFFELVGSSTTQFAGAAGTVTTVDILYPTGTTVNDVIIVAVALHDQTTAWPSTATMLPAGWAGWGATSSTASAFGYMTRYRVSTGEQSATIQMPCTAGAGVALVAAIRGCDPTNTTIDNSALSTGASGDPVPTAHTITTADSLFYTVAWMDDDNASAVAAPTTCVVAAATTYSVGGTLFAVSTGADGTAGNTVMMAFRPAPTTGAISFSTWSVTNADDEWAAFSATLRHD